MLALEIICLLALVLLFVADFIPGLKTVVPRWKEHPVAMSAAAVGLFLLAVLFHHLR